jgi:hypothetical protein
MIRRVACGKTTSTPMVANALSNSTRTYLPEPFSVVSACFFASLFTWHGAILFNSVKNVHVFGGFRFMMELDKKPIQDFPMYRYVGGTLGFLFWFFVIAPANGCGLVMNKHVRTWASCEYSSFGPGPSNVLRPKEYEDYINS